MNEILLYVGMGIISSGYIGFFGYGYYINNKSRNRFIDCVEFKSVYTNEIVNKGKSSLMFAENLITIIEKNKNSENINSILNSNEIFRKYVASSYYYGSSKDVRKLVNKVTNLSKILMNNLNYLNIISEKFDDSYKDKLKKLSPDGVELCIHLMRKNSEEEAIDELNLFISELSLVLEKVRETKSLYKTIINPNYKLELDELLINFVSDHLNNIELDYDVEFSIDLVKMFAKETMETKLKTQKALSKYNKKSKLSEEDRFKTIKESLHDNK